MDGPHAIDPANYKKEAVYPDGVQPYQQSYGQPDSGLEVAPHQQTHTGYGQYQPVQGGHEPSPPRTILGLRRTTFFLSVALIVVILAAAVGGGVGGSIAVQNARNNANNSNATATKTVTVTHTVGQSSTPSTSGDSSGGSKTTASGLVVPTGVLALDCPALDSAGNQKITLGDKTWSFKPSCGTDSGGFDIGAVIVYSFHDCLQACAAHNHFYGEDQCVVAHFSADMAPLIASDYGNCWLKNGTNFSSGWGNLVATGELQ